MSIKVNGNTNSKHIQQDTDRQRWISPKVGKLDTNVDAAIDILNRSSGVGGIVRDHLGRCVRSYHRFWYTSLSPFMVELKAIKEAISIARDTDINEFYIHFDSQNAISAVNNKVCGDDEFLADDNKKVRASSYDLLFSPSYTYRTNELTVKKTYHHYKDVIEEILEWLKKL
ncbi:hypothetical protein G4B88_014976 [Cannabis sativa]|uniref:RNase H type-1 domain-containing protein n=1 Tax=Cannabis sativa TaxID=3483 RepID=A0A7J6F2B5_CANSA|nr:hypothetical protein G4B88_014976 [Cannabis sativa]